MARTTCCLSPLGLIAEQLLDERGDTEDTKFTVLSRNHSLHRILSQARSAAIFRSKDKPQTFRGHFPLSCFNQSLPINQHLVSARGGKDGNNYV